MAAIQMQQIVVPPGTIDLGVGQPSTDLLPTDFIRRAFDDSFTRRDILQYGAEWGDGQYRMALANFLTAAYGCPVHAEQLFASNGNSQAIDMVSAVLGNPGDVVFVEDPTYFLSLRIFTDRGLQVVSVRTDHEGLIVADLAEKLDRIHRSAQRAAFVYTIPAFHNPTTVSMSEQRRQALVALCAQHQLPLVADEVYHLLDVSSPAEHAHHPTPNPLSAFIDQGPVLSLGTFSKILAPGLRLGWMHGSNELLERFAASGLIVSGGGLNPVAGYAATSAMTSGWLDQHLLTLRTTYARRIAMVSAILHEQLGSFISFDQPMGGYFFWLRLPDHIDGAAVRAVCQQHHVDVRHGALFSPADGSGFSNYLRISFAFYEDDQLAEGIHRLCTAVRAA